MKSLQNVGYILPIRPDTPSERMYTKFGTAVGVAGVIICDKIFGDRLRVVVVDCVKVKD